MSDVISMEHTIAAKLAPFGTEDRINYLTAMLVAEICRLPPEQRLPELKDVIDVLPCVFRAAQETMRFELAADARVGL